MESTSPEAAALAPQPLHGGSGARPLQPFALERFFAKYEFCTPHLLCCSDSEPLTMAELLELADDDVRQRWASLRLAYTESQGLPALREAIAGACFTSVQPGQVVVAAPQELVLLTMQALLRPGDRVVCTFPGYQSLYEVAASLGCRVEPWPLRALPGGALGFSLADAERLVTPGTRLVIVNSPHNPSGAHFSAGDWRALCALCEAAGAHLFSDEMYRGLELDPAGRLPAAVDCLPRAISLGGTSKAVGGPGLRIGWVATKDAALLARMLELKDYTTICGSAPSEVLALAAVRSWDALVQRSLAVIRPNLAALDAFFARWPALFEWRRPAAGTVAFPRLLLAEAGCGGEGVEAWCEALATEAGVLLMPATVYGHADSVAQGRFRLGFGRRDLPQVLEQLEGWLRARYPQLRQGGGGGGGGGPS